MMKRIVLILVTTIVFASPVAAQQMDHSMHGDHGHHQKAIATPESVESQVRQAPMNPSMNGGHDHPEDMGAARDKNVTPDPAHMDHSQHDGPMHHMPASGDPPEKPASPAARSGPSHAADRAYGSAVMADARVNMLREHGDSLVAKLMLDRLEAHVGQGEDGYAWEGDLWIGKDDNKLWLKSEGEGSFGNNAEHAEIQALWSHAIGPWFDLQTGVRHDFKPTPDRTHLVVGVQGLAPYWFEVSGEMFLSDKGDVTARAEADYDLRITNRLIAQPRLELGFSFQDVPQIGLGDGLTDAALGWRLRYEITPQFAPYAGAEWEGKFGETKLYAKAAGEDPSHLTLLFGVRFWF